eukprot:19-Pleurochrysis_carterae.AAC.1
MNAKAEVARRASCEPLDSCRQFLVKLAYAQMRQRSKQKRLKLANLHSHGTVFILHLTQPSFALRTLVVYFINNPVRA